MSSKRSLSITIHRNILYVWSSKIQAHLKWTDFYSPQWGRHHHQPPKSQLLLGSLDPRCGSPELTGRTDSLLCSVTWAWWMVAVEGTSQWPFTMAGVRKSPPSIFPKHGWSLGMSVRFFKQKNVQGSSKSSIPFTGRWTWVAFASSWVMRYLQIIHPQSLGFFGIVPGGLTLHPLEKIGLPYASH